MRMALGADAGTIARMILARGVAAAARGHGARPARQRRRGTLAGRRGLARPRVDPLAFAAVAALLMIAGLLPATGRRAARRASIRCWRCGTPSNSAQRRSPNPLGGARRNRAVDELQHLPFGAARRFFHLCGRAPPSRRRGCPSRCRDRAWAASSSRIFTSSARICVRARAVSASSLRRASSRRAALAIGLCGSARVLTASACLPISPCLVPRTPCCVPEHALLRAEDALLRAERPCFVPSSPCASPSSPTGLQIWRT